MGKKIKRYTPISDLYARKLIVDPSVCSRRPRKRKKLLPGFIITIASVISLTCFFIFGFRQKMSVAMPEVEVNAVSAIVTDVLTGTVLLEKGPDVRLQPASTVKIMTALVAMDKMPMDAYIVPSSKVLSVEPTICGLKPGVKYRLRDLISAIIIKSANDAAFVIAEGVGGSEEKFVRMMNEKGRRIGMENTNFTSPSGLPAYPREKQYTTARDLAVMMRYALRYRFLLEEMARTSKYIKGDDGRKLFLKTHNKSLYKPDRAAWGKTGYTKKARRTFVGIDPDDDPKIVIAMLKSRDLWDDIAILKKEGLKAHESMNESVVYRFKKWLRARKNN